MKKIFKITAIIIVVLFLVILITPVLFKSKIVETVKTEINNTVNAKVEFQDVKLSLLKNFPNFFFGLYELSVVGIDEFESDTLISFSSVQFNINLASVIGGDQIKINSILIDNPIINAIVLKNGKANWDIVESETDTLAVDTVSDVSESAFSLGLKEFIINNATISYLDDESNMYSQIKNLNFLLKGDFTQDFTNIEADLSIESLNYKMDGIDYLTDAVISYKAGLDADIENNKFTLKENIFKLNEIEFGLNGFVEMPGDDINMDINFDLKETSFKDLLSLIPVVYKTDFDDVETNGEFSFKGFAKGIYNDSHLPAFDLSLYVNNAMFKYPELPDAVDHINVDISINSPGGSEDNTNIDINRLQMRIADNPINMIMHIKTPVSDPEISAALIVNLDLESLNAVVPVSGMKMSGLLNSNLQLDGKLSTLEEEKYEDFNAKGFIKMKSFKLTMDDLPYKIIIDNAQLSFSPKITVLNSFDMQIGESDFHLQGQFSNYIAYAFDKGVLQGKLNYRSKYINVDEFMLVDSSEIAEDESLEQDTVPLTVFEVPDNIHIELIAGIEKLKYDNLVITGMTGKIELLDNKAMLNNYKMYMLNGILICNGEYNTYVINEPKVDFNMEISGFDISSTYKTFMTVQKLAPVAKNMHGNFSTSFSFNSLLNGNMEPIYNTILSDGRIVTKNIEVKGGSIMNKIGKALKTKRFDDMEVNDIDIKYHIENGVIEVDPFQVKAANTIIEIFGNQGIDGNLNYNMMIDLPTSSLGTETNSAIANLTGTETTSNNTIAVNALVSGYYNDPNVKLIRGGGKGLVGNIKDNVKKKKEEVKKTVKSNVKKSSKAKAQKIINDADKQAQKVVREAEKTAETIRYEADKAGDKLIAEAKKKGNDLITKAGNNIIKKKLAQESAKKLNKEAAKRANQLNTEADNKANKLVDEAKTKADKIRSEAQKKADAL